MIKFFISLSKFVSFIKISNKLDEKTIAGWRDAIPLKRGGTTEDIANACVFLGSDMSAYITGQVLQVDGGMLT